MGKRTKLRVVKKLGSYNPGDTLEMDSVDTNILVSLGVAEVLTESEKTAKPSVSHASPDQTSVVTRAMAPEDDNPMETDPDQPEASVSRTSKRKKRQEQTYTRRDMTPKAPKG